jgi:P pilus assembly chaperone PapD
MNTNGTYLQKALAFVLSVIFWLFVYKIGHGATNTILSPTRIVFDKTSGTLKEFTVTNTGKETVKYTLSIIDMRMRDDGKLEPVAQPITGQLSAIKYLFVYPEQFELAPNESHIVKVRLSATPSKEAGEYRSHLYLKQEKTGTSASDAARGITMPVIVRTGELTARATISGISLKLVNDDAPLLQLTVNRDGNASLYGDINVSFIDSTGKATTVGAVKGTAVYTPNKQRTFSIKLNGQQGIDYHHGKLKVEYAGSSVSAPSAPIQTPLAESEYVLQ